ncbi:MAG TPA: TlpA disulfide reductase family protein [Chitinophagaceae bacterium]|nr:TlpA disulfide reductase family protein [Chitinophagaceae bacterium]
MADLNLYFKADMGIDSVLVANFTQDREFQFMPYKNALNITFNDSINDYYFLKFFTGKGALMYPLWLNGKNVIIKGKITDKVKIDTVIGSTLYYKSLDFRKKYTELNDSKTDAVTINNFLLTELKQNISNPFSIEIARNFFSRNMSNKNELKTVYSILSNQEDGIQNSLMNPIKEIQKILVDDKVDLSNFSFYDIDRKMTSLKPKKGNKILIDFWFVSCAPCIKEHKAIAGKLGILNSNNIDLVGISIDDDHEKWKDYLKEKKYNWLNLREADEPENKLRTEMLISTFPTYLLLDSEGNVLHRTNSFEEMEKYLKI